MSCPGLLIVGPGYQAVSQKPEGLHYSNGQDMQA